MDEPSLVSALDRAERALDRIDRALKASHAARRRDAALRDRVQGVVAELDDLIRSAGGR